MKSVSVVVFLWYLCMCRESLANELTSYKQLSQAVFAGERITFLVDLSTCAPAAPSTVRITPADILVLEGNIVVNKTHYEFDVPGYSKITIVKNIEYTFTPENVLKVKVNYLDFSSGTPLQESPLISCRFEDSDLRIYAG